MVYRATKHEKDFNVLNKKKVGVDIESRSCEVIVLQKNIDGKNPKPWASPESADFI